MYGKTNNKQYVLLNSENSPPEENFVHQKPRKKNRLLTTVRFDGVRYAPKVEENNRSGKTPLSSRIHHNIIVHRRDSSLTSHACHTAALARARARLVYRGDSHIRVPRRNDLHCDAVMTNRVRRRSVHLTRGVVVGPGLFGTRVLPCTRDEHFRFRSRTPTRKIAQCRDRQRIFNSL